MAEVKNNFIKSKMNKDLDARLVPQGEYRNAVNAQISRSEGEGVGSLENILGNYDIASFEPTIQNLTSIGYYVDQVNDFIYVFLTDNSTGQYIASGDGSNHFIYRVNPSPTTVQVEKLVQGPFLNFSKLNPIYGVNLLEDLLFWTDNRNQPRTINVLLANPTNLPTPIYYVTEDQISVAKYNPYQAIDVWKASGADYESTMKDVTSKFLPTGSTAIVDAQLPPPGNYTKSDNWNIKGGNYNFFPNKPEVGQTVGYINSSGGAIQTLLDSNNAPVKVAASPAPTTATVSFTGTVTLAENDELVFFPNPYYDPNYAGDSAFLEDKFVRFSYRFKFRNNEYSLIAPFTQACFIPKQDGYFLTTGDTDLDNNQDQAVSSSIVSFMENKVNSIGLQIPLPSSKNTLINDFKVSEIDILYKESDALTVKVVETVQAATLTGTNKFFEYIYTGKKPYKTLLETEIARVYDKVPVRAFAQESSGNRIIYSNFQNRHTPPLSLDYSVAATEKSEFSLLTGSAIVSDNTVVDTQIIPLTSFTPIIQIGSIVSWAGSPEDITVESIANGNTSVTVNVNVTIANGTALVFSQSSNTQYTTSTVEYPNHTLKTNRSYQVGIVLSDKFGRTSDVILSNSNNLITIGQESYSGPSLYSPYISESVDPNSWRGNSLKVLFNTPIGPSSPDSSTFAPGLYNNDVTSSLYNPLGWYSYKIVVQQKEQEYYNVYAPGAIKGTLVGNGAIATEDQNTSYVVLINDNINKVPRDLSEVGPQDKTFRSSVQLIGRVENNFNQWNTGGSETPPTSSNTGNQQYFPKTRTFTTNAIQPLFDAFDWPASGFTTGASPVSSPLDNQQGLFAFYKAETNPFLAEITTSQLTTEQFGVVNLSSPDFIVSENLIVLETKPVISLLDIYYETSTSGLISELNTAILNDLGVSNLLSNFNPDLFNEEIADNASISGNNFTLINNFGVNLVPVQDYTSFELVSAVQDFGNNNFLDVKNIAGGAYFELVGNNTLNSYNVRVSSNFVNNVYYNSNNPPPTFNLEFTAVLQTGESIQYTEIIELINNEPLMYDAGNLSPLGNVIPLQLTLGTNAAPLNINNFLITRLYGRNGANVTDNPNTRENLAYNINTVFNSAGQNITNIATQYFEIQELDEQTTPTVRTGIVRQVAGATVPSDNYLLNINLSDGGGLIRSLALTLIYKTIPNNPYPVEKLYTINPNAVFSEIFVEVEFSGLSSGNGFYIFTGDWATLVSQIFPNGSNTITIPPNPITTGSCPPSSVFNQGNGVWFYGGNVTNSQQVAQNKIKSCLNLGPTLSLGGNIAIPTANNYGWFVS